MCANITRSVPGPIPTDGVLGGWIISADELWGWAGRLLREQIPVPRTKEEMRSPAFRIFDVLTVVDREFDQSDFAELAIIDMTEYMVVTHEYLFQAGDFTDAEFQRVRESPRSAFSLGTRSRKQPSPSWPSMVRFRMSRDSHTEADK